MPSPFFIPPTVLHLLVPFAVSCAVAAFAAEQPSVHEEAQPGLLAEYRTLARGTEALSVHQIDPKPSFTWGRSSPHPRLPEGPFEAVWTGRVELEGDESLRFAAFVSGAVRVEVDGEEVLNAELHGGWHQSDKSFSRPAGAYPIQVVFHSAQGSPARLQLWWSGQSFSPEPIPAYRFSHPGAAHSEPWRLDAQRERGRTIVSQLGCAQCHREAFPSIEASPPGPLLTGLGDRVTREWLRDWLEDPGKSLPHAKMPSAFTHDRNGFVERALIAEYLSEKLSTGGRRSNAEGDHRSGRQNFVGLGCATCHFLPEETNPGPGQSSARPSEIAFRDIYQDRLPLTALGDRFNVEQLARFLLNPAERYPDGRMPRLPMPENIARDIAAYLLLWSKPSEPDAASAPPRPDEIRKLAERLGTPPEISAIGAALVREKGCAACHSDLRSGDLPNIPLRLSAFDDPDSPRGCLSAGGRPHFPLDDSSRAAVVAYAKIAQRERFHSPFHQGQRELDRAQCFRCHQGDSLSPASMEEIGKTLWTPHLMRLAYQRTPRLTQALSKYTRRHLRDSIRDGVSGIRPAWYSYKMPVYGNQADRLVEALAAHDGDALDAEVVQEPEHADPTLRTFGATLVGFEGYACVSCHVWKGRELTSVDPGAVGPELTTVNERINPDWFIRWLENPARQHPGTPMPAFFEKGKPAPIDSVLDGDVSRQIEALRAFFSQGTNAPDLTPKRSIPIVLPSPHEPPLVAQIPIAMGQGETLESIALQSSTHDLVLYDLAKGTIHSYRAGVRILRNPNGWRTFVLSESEGEDVWSLAADPSIASVDKQGQASQGPIEFLGYDLLRDGVRIRSRIAAPSGPIQMHEELRLHGTEPRLLIRRFQADRIPAGLSMTLQTRIPPALIDASTPSHSRIQHAVAAGQVEVSSENGILAVHLTPDRSSGSFDLTLSYPLPPAKEAKTPAVPQVDPASVKRLDDSDGRLVRPGYRAIRYPMPKTAGHEDRVMPSALAADPRTGRLFVASLKLGELFVLHDPHDNGIGASFKDYARGLFQDAYSMLHDGDALYLLHRRNLTRISDTDGDGFADRFDRIAALHQNPGNTYDWAYGLVRDTAGSYIISFAPYADNKHLPGMGGILKLKPGPNGTEVTEIGSGLRNAFGWTAGPDGEMFFTDNQGDWVPANKLCHVVPGKNYGYPNPTRPDLVRESADSAAVWVPYDWAKSINGVAYDTTEGKFGPFAGQFFMAELMHGGAIVRANVEKINGIYQGACFPFWGQGLLGPLALTFDPKGRLWVGSITQPGWMAQPDRGALFRIDYTGEVPFEIQSIHVRPGGFRLIFTRPVSPDSATSLLSYVVEHFRYEFSGAYGSPELDRTPVNIEKVTLGPDGRTVEITTGALVKNRVYSITASGVRSAAGEPLLHPQGVYTLRTVPAE